MCAPQFLSFDEFFFFFFFELKIFDLACAKGFVKVPRKRVFTPLSSSLKIATAKLLFLKLNSSMKIPKIIQRIMRWILLVGSPGWTNKYRASVISVLRITYCTFWLIQFYRLFTTLVPQKRLSKCPSRRRILLYFCLFSFSWGWSTRARLWFIFTELLTILQYTMCNSLAIFEIIWLLPQCMKWALINWDCNHNKQTKTIKNNKKWRRKEKNTSFD